MQAVNDVARAMHPTAGLQPDVRVVTTTPCSQGEDGRLTPLIARRACTTATSHAGLVVGALALLLLSCVLVRNPGK